MTQQLPPRESESESARVARKTIITTLTAMRI
jgi:hypothetical protein